ncbi:hypothetical protein AC579_442 [Pseudocercospora musae]|uniref:Amine oxidase n=1 Tax=Pseudocercospora musae TaxID=113226 RepID=A0A139I630_9PEZI|nr:hypothetical protein AC579_442 [Pseudocercospora musae]KXT10213.1 hypothetical protein AC579_442 [Pseudocercospora musae]
MSPPYPPAGATLLTPHNIRTSPFYSLTTHTTSPSSIIITTAGQIGAYPDGTIPHNPTTQIQRAFSNLKTCLHASGARIQDILKLTYYIVNYDHKNPIHRPFLMEFLGEHRPATTLIPVEKLAMPEFVFEVEATAAIPQEGGVSSRVDVVVVGAGLSGLSTAVKLQKAGLRVKVLEARDRVGGKTCSREVLGGRSVCDVGAAWINDSNQSKMFELSQRYGLEVVVQNSEGEFICDEGIGRHKRHPYGTLEADEDGSDGAEIGEIVRVRDMLEEMCQKIDIRNPVASGKKLREDLDMITVEEWLRSVGAGEDAVNAMKVGTRAMLGVEPSEMSATYFLDYCKSGGGYMQMRGDRKHGGQYLRVKKGTQSFSEGLAGELAEDAIVFMSPVRKIEQIAGAVRVTSARGVYEASRVVVSLPTPLYKEITWSPSLPSDKLEMAGSTMLGDYCKSIVFYKTPWWRKHGLTGMSQSARGPFGVTRDSSVDADEHYSLTCFLVGQPAREWRLLSPEERRKAVLAQIQHIFGKFAQVEEPIHIEEQIWQDEQWSQGCPCPVFGPGGLTKFEATLRAPTGRIHFVGTETAFEWKGYMEGAVRSGERGAQEVLLALNAAKL